MIMRFVEVLPQAAVPIVILFGLLAGGLLASILAMLHRDALDSAEEADLARLTAQLPEDLRPGRHRYGVAAGTPVQRRLWESDTEVYDVADLRAMLAAEDLVEVPA